MHRAAACLIMALAGAVVACADAELRPTPTLHELGASWSAGRSDPVCRDRGPRGEYLDPLLGQEYCQWPYLSQGDAWGVVGGHRSKLGLDQITWERQVKSVGVVNYLRDSLSKEFRAMGMAELKCRNPGDLRWERRDFGVMFLNAETFAGGKFKITVIATTTPSSLDGPVCTNPSRPRGSRRPGA